MSLRPGVLMLDLDGTVLGPDGSISAGTGEALSRARDLGWEVVIATGRTRSESVDLLEAIGHRGISIYAGGALACDGSSGRTIHRRVLADGVVDVVAPWLIEHGHRVLILKDRDAAGFDYLAVGSAAFHEATIWWFAQRPIEVVEVCALADDPCPEASVRVGAVADGGVLDEFETTIRATLGDRARVLHWSAVTGSHAVNAPVCLLEVLDREADKWSMLQYLRQDLEVVTPEGPVIAVGDGLNDVEMLSHADVGIAMGHASPAVMAHADRVTEDYRSRGLVTAIDAVLAGEIDRLSQPRRDCG